MCYKDEEQIKDNKKLEEKLKGIPQFIQDYFVFLPSSKTKLSYWSYIKQLLEWFISQNITQQDIYNITPDDLNHVTDVHIVKYLDGLKSGLYGTKNSYTTIETKKNVFSGFWSYLEDKNYVRKNIITKQVSNKYKVKEEKEVVIPTDEEITELLSNLESIKSEIIAIRNIAIVKLFIGSGLRIDELVGLDMDDLFYDSKDNCYKVWVMEKGEQNKEVAVPINQTAYNAINDYINIRNSKPEIKDMKPMFISERGDRLAKSSIQDFIDEYSNGKIHAHMLRHYTGTKLYEASEYNLELVREQLRHGNINTTAKYYVKNNKTATVAALNKF